jgi:ribonucleotide monophosphatase NagD (HAD superfamily)
MDTPEKRNLIAAVRALPQRGDEVVTRDGLVRFLTKLVRSGAEVPTRSEIEVTQLVDAFWKGNYQRRVSDFIDWLMGEKPHASQPSVAIKGPGPVLPKPDDGTEIEFLTDVEGNWDHFLHYVHESKILNWEGDPQGAWGPGNLVLKDDSILVYGGDATDKGPGDIRFAKTLLSLKERYPDRVFIIIGNRDCSKLRLHAELAEGEQDTPIKPWWPASKKTYDDYMEKRNLERGPLSYLLWALDCNLGCQETTFGLRKQEIGLLKGRANDQDAVDSFRDSVDPDGADPFMLNLIRVGHLALIIGDTFFCHGGLDDTALGYVPGLDNRLTNMKDWVEALERFKDAEVKEFEKRRKWRMENGERVRGGIGLISYCLPGPHTIVYHNPFKEGKGNPSCLSTTVEDFLISGGIHRMACGHQPHGQSPVVVRHPRTGFISLHCDTSYSDMQALKVINKADNRGNVLCVTTLRGPKVTIEGVATICKDVTKHSCTLDVDQTLDDFPDAFVGRQFTDGSWAKSIFEDEHMVKWVLCTVCDGFNVGTIARLPNQATLMLRQEHICLNCFTFDFSTCSGGSLRERNISFHPTPDASTMEGADPEDPATYHFDRNAFWSLDAFVIRLTRQFEVLRQEERELSLQKTNALVEAGKRVLFLSVNSSRSRQDLLEFVSNLGYKVPNGIGDIVTSSYTCAWFLKRAGIRRPFVMCNTQTGLLKELRHMGITEYEAVVEDDGTPKDKYLQEATGDTVKAVLSDLGKVDAVVCGWDLQLTAMKVTVASSVLKWSADEGQPIPFVACGRDDIGVLGHTGSDFMTQHGYHERSIPTMGNGSMAEAISLAAGRNVTPIHVGIPSDVMMETLRRPADSEGYNVDFGKTAMIGPSMEYDGEFAQRSGMKFLLILPGIKAHWSAVEKHFQQKGKGTLAILHQPSLMETMSRGNCSLGMLPAADIEEAMQRCSDRIPTWIVDNLGDI